VKGFVDASSVFQSNESSVLVESACESKGTCDVDMRAFMGIFARTLARTALAAPIVSGSINKLLSTSAKAAASACSGGSDPSCPLGWTADSKWESASAKDGNLGEVFNALGVVQGLLYPSAKALKTAGGAKEVLVERPARMRRRTWVLLILSRRALLLYSWLLSRRR
jgi:mannan endo-1,6-alpha-mannosidase